MNAELALRWFKAAVIVAIAVWELVQLTRRRHDLALRVLVPGLLCLAFAATVGIRTPMLAPVKEFFGSAWTPLINGCWMAMAYAWAAYFLLADTSKPVSTRVRAAWLELGVFVIAVITMVVMLEVWPVEARSGQYRTWQRAVFYLAVDGYSLVAWFVGIRRASRYLTRLVHPWARTAFWVVIVGSAAMALGVNAVSLIRQAIRAVSPQAKLEVLSTLYSAGQLGGQLLLAFGLALAPLATAVVTVKMRYEQALRIRYTAEMRPLWRTLTVEFPHIALDIHHSGGRRSGDDDFERITAEITDGLAELARDCPEPGGDPREPVVAANMVEAALRRRAQARDARWVGDEPEPIEPPYPRVEPDFHDSWRRRAQWMIRLGDELTRRGAIGKELERGTVGE